MNHRRNNNKCNTDELISLPTTGLIREANPAADANDKRYQLYVLF